MLAASIFLVFACATAKACSAAECDDVQMLQTLEAVTFMLAITLDLTLEMCFLIFIFNDNNKMNHVFI